MSCNIQIFRSDTEDTKGRKKCTICSIDPGWSDVCICNVIYQFRMNRIVERDIEEWKNLL